MKALVTGAAGFIGSNLCDYLIEKGWDVVGVDSFTTHYDPQFKRLNLYDLSFNDNFELIEKDLAYMPHEELVELIKSVDVVFHLAARAGVRSSWGERFVHYLSDNILVTQNLLDAMKEVPSVELFYAGTSSVYGDTMVPFDVNQRTKPVSPYGVTKNASEDLIRLYHRWHGVHYTILRLFNVYGPRQRPDMAFGRLIMSGLMDKPFNLYGGVKREFTYVEDVCEAFYKAAERKADCYTYNISGGSVVSMDATIKIIEKELGKEINVLRNPGVRGDANITQAAEDWRLERWWLPSTLLKDGIEKQIRWVKENLNQASYYLNEV